MRWKQAAGAPAGWAEALDRGLSDVDQGRVVPISDVIADLDDTLAEVTTGRNDQVGRGNDLPHRKATNRRS